jgi:integrase
MGLIKRGRQYYVDYYHAGRRIRDSAGSRDEARIILAERLQDIRQGRDPGLRKIKPKPFAEMVTEFKERHVAMRRSKRHFEVRLRVLEDHFGDQTLQTIAPGKIEEYMAGRLASGVSKATVNRERAVLSKLFNCAIKWGHFGGENPVRRVPAFQESPGRTRYLTKDEADTLVEKAARHLKPILTTALYTGGRLTEILRLKWEDIDLDRGVLYFDQTNTKSGKQREIPIRPELAAVLQERNKVRAIRPEDDFVFTWGGRGITRLTRAFETARKRAGLGEDVTFHVLRHTFASWYIINGGDPFRLQKYLGHSDMSLTQRYAHLSADYLKAGAEHFGPPADGPKAASHGPKMDPNAIEAGSAGSLSA